MRIRGRNLLLRLREGLLRRLAPGPKILLYHRVAELSSDPQLLAVSPARFAEQLSVLRDGWQVLPLGDLVQAVLAHKASRRMVAITFDDGYADNLYQARPLLARGSLGHGVCRLGHTEHRAGVLVG